MYILVLDLLSPKLLTWVKAWLARLRGALGVIRSFKTGEAQAPVARRAKVAERNFILSLGNACTAETIAGVSMTGAGTLLPGQLRRARTTVIYQAMANCAGTA
jgi:hypothetical protein